MRDAGCGIRDAGCGIKIAGYGRQEEPGGIERNILTLGAGWRDCPKNSDGMRDLDPLSIVDLLI